MSLISEEDQAVLKEVFSKRLQGHVTIAVFTKKSDCEYCNELVELAKEVTSLDPRLSYEVYDFDENRDKAKEYNVEMAPAIGFANSTKYNFHFYGIPAGYEFNAFIDDIIDISRNTTRLAPITINRLKTIQQDVRIQVFVTPSCPYCPRAVRLAHQFSMANSRIRGDMIEALEFEDLANEYGVMSVPHIVINNSYVFIGAVPEAQFLNYLFDALEGKGSEGPIEGGEVSQI
ncbi:MAG: protein disulfide oxidoreductase [Nitrososphaeria archaeon]